MENLEFLNLPLYVLAGLWLLWFVVKTVFRAEIGDFWKKKLRPQPDKENVLTKTRTDVIEAAKDAFRNHLRDSLQLSDEHAARLREVVDAPPFEEAIVSLIVLQTPDREACLRLVGQMLPHVDEPSFQSSWEAMAGSISVEIANNREISKGLSLEKTIEDLAKQPTKAGSTEDDPKIEFSRAIKDWAVRYGLSAEEAHKEVEEWIEETRRAKSDERKLGLAEFAAQNFPTAAEHFRRAAESQEEHLAALREKAEEIKAEEARVIHELIRDLSLEARSLYNANRFSESIAVYEEVFVHQKRSNAPQDWAMTQNISGPRSKSRESEQAESRQRSCSHEPFKPTRAHYRSERKTCCPSNGRAPKTISGTRSPSRESEQAESRQRSCSDEPFKPTRAHYRSSRKTCCPRTGR